MKKKKKFCEHLDNDTTTTSKPPPPQGERAPSLPPSLPPQMLAASRVRRHRHKDVHKKRGKAE